MSSSKKRRELNRAAEEYDRVRISTELASGRINMENLAESVMGQRITVLEKQLALIQKAVTVIEMDSDEVLDFDECTAMLVPMDAYTALIDAAAVAEQG